MEIFTPAYFLVAMVVIAAMANGSAPPMVTIPWAGAILALIYIVVNGISRHPINFSHVFMLVLCVVVGVIATVDWKKRQ